MSLQLIQMFICGDNDDDYGNGDEKEVTLFSEGGALPVSIFSFQ